MFTREVGIAPARFQGIYCCGEPPARPPRVRKLPWSGLKARTIVGRQIDDRPYRGDAVTSVLNAWADAAGNWTMWIRDAWGEFREGRAGGRNWIRKPGGEVEPNDHRNVKLAFLLNPQGPLMIGEYFPNLKLTGTWDYDGIEYYKVENDLKFEYYTLYFEVDSGLLTRIGYHWLLEGFREVAEHLVPGGK